LTDLNNDIDIHCDDQDKDDKVPGDQSRQ